MDRKKRRKLERDGWRVGTVAEFLGLSKAEAAQVERRVRLSAPVHPGAVLRHDCLEFLGLSVTATAKILGVSRHAVTTIINGRGGIRAEMAIRLSKAFGSTPETWLAMQVAHDLAQARKRQGKIRVRRYQRSNRPPPA